MKYDVKVYSDFGMCKFSEKLYFKADKASENAFFEVEFLFPEWEADTFVFMPSCAYNGNRFKSVKRKYPPRYLPEEFGTDNEPLIGNIPTLGYDGKGEIEVTSADMAVPCIGLYYKQKKQGLFIMTPQQVKGKNIGYTVSEGKIKLSYPANRKNPYYAFKYDDYNEIYEPGIKISSGEEIESPVYINEFACVSFEDFYSKYFSIRKQIINGNRAENMYTDKLWNIVEEFNNTCWSGKTYPKHNPWHVGGWCNGCGIESLGLYKKGNEISRERAVKALEFDFQPSHFTEAGFLYTTVKDSVPDGKLHLTRFSAGSLYMLMKCLEVVPQSETLTNAAKKCADAFVKLFEKYGKFGSYINAETGEMLVGYGSSGVLATGALAKCGEFFGNDVYTNTAVKAAEYYYNDFMKNGMTCGGPGDILSAPDSESAFMTLEAYIALYECTKEKKWLDFAETLAKYCSSWVVSYIFEFPEGTEFNRLGINTVGSVFASVQNAHSAPGICTLSGDSIYKLYKFTGKREYLELIKDIAYFIPQCISTDERPIYAKMGEPEGVSRPLKQGWICERVNMSDWERKFNGVGNVFYCNCWCSNSLLLSFAELADYPEFKD